MEYAISAATASYKVLRSWVLARRRGHTVLAEHGSHKLVSFISGTIDVTKYASKSENTWNFRLSQ